MKGSDGLIEEEDNMPKVHPEGDHVCMCAHYLPQYVFLFLRCLFFFLSSFARLWNPSASLMASITTMEGKKER